MPKPPILKPREVIAILESLVLRCLCYLLVNLSIQRLDGLFSPQSHNDTKIGRLPCSSLVLSSTHLCRLLVSLSIQRSDETADCFVEVQHSHGQALG